MGSEMCIRDSPVKEGDDPQAAIRMLLAALAQLDFTVPPSCTTGRLQTGAGPEVCAVLDALANWSLEQTKFAFNQVQLQAGGDDACAFIT